MNRAWTYIINRPLTPAELEQLKEAGNTFVTGWTAHENKLSGGFRVFKDRIIVVTVNEDIHQASGCSIDKLTRFIKEQEARFGIELLNRLLIACKAGDAVEVIHASQVRELLAKQVLSGDSVIYNTAVSNEEELSHWEQPLKATWLNKYLNTPAA